MEEISNCRQVLNRLTRVDEDSFNSLDGRFLLLLAELLSRRTGRLPEAQSAGKRAVELRQSGQDRIAESEAHNNLGLLIGPPEC